MREITVPSILTNLNGQELQTDPVSYDFQKNRRIYITGEIDARMANSVISQLQYLNNASDGDITIFINSPGGSVSDGLAIYDCMKQGVACDVVTVATGMAASMGAFLLAAGTPGKRYATENAEIMIHQPLGGIQGQATDITLEADHIYKLKKKLAGILANTCGKTLRKLLSDTERNNWMSSIEAKQYGLIDYVGYPSGNVEVSYEYV